MRCIAKKDRRTNFYLFDKQIKWSRYSLADTLSGKYDFYSIGSDQVWNTNWYHVPYRKETFLLQFAKSEERICMAPSFGLSELPEQWQPMFKKELSHFPKLSVREEAGRKLIYDLIGKKAEVLIDPTLMLEKDEWLQLAKSPKGVDTACNYILLYFLSGISEKKKKEIQEYAKQYDCRIYDVLDPAQKNVYCSGPSEFLYLLAHAQLILTDSFHACVFSFLFQKPFYVYDRIGKEKDMFSRIETLLTKLKLQRKYAESGLKNDMLECDYHIGFEKLKEERKRFLSFIKASISNSLAD